MPFEGVYIAPEDAIIANVTIVMLVVHIQRFQERLLQDVPKIWAFGSVRAIAAVLPPERSPSSKPVERGISKNLLGF